MRQLTSAPWLWHLAIAASFTLHLKITLWQRCRVIHSVTVKKEIWDNKLDSLIFKITSVPNSNFQSFKFLYKILNFRSSRWIYDQYFDSGQALNINITDYGWIDWRMDGTTFFFKLFFPIRPYSKHGKQVEADGQNTVCHCLPSTWTAEPHPFFNNIIKHTAFLWIYVAQCSFLHNFTLLLCNNTTYNTTVM